MIRFWKPGMVIFALVGLAWQGSYLVQPKNPVHLSQAELLIAKQLMQAKSFLPKMQQERLLVAEARKAAIAKDNYPKEQGAVGTPQSANPVTNEAQTLAVDSPTKPFSPAYYHHATQVAHYYQALLNEVPSFGNIDAARRSKILNYCRHEYALQNKH